MSVHRLLFQQHLAAADIACLMEEERSRAASCQLFKAAVDELSAEAIMQEFQNEMLQQLQLLIDDNGEVHSAAMAFMDKFKEQLQHCEETIKLKNDPICRMQAHMSDWFNSSAFDAAVMTLSGVLLSSSRCNPPQHGRLVFVSGGSGLPAT